MGNIRSRSENAAAGSGAPGDGCGPAEGGMLFLLYRTWAVVVPEFRSAGRARRKPSQPAGTSPGFADPNKSDIGSSQYSFCSCSQCRNDDDIISDDCLSDLLFDPNFDMAPNSDDSPRLTAYSKSSNSLWNDDTLSKEKQRPPIYNPEDYAMSLKKWGRRPPAGSPGLYSNSSDFECPLKSAAQGSPGPGKKDYRNPMLTSVGGEMSLRQFGSVSELLTKLRSDLRLAFPSFVQEFIADPLDGVTLLLELLRAIQLSQAAGTGTGTATSSTSANCSTGCTNPPNVRVPPGIQRRALLDELACLQCLLCACHRYSEAVRRLTASSAGLFTLAVCIMSNVTKSRIIALQLLTKACEPSGCGHTAVSEALSTLRLRFGEPVRFRFLVGMITSAGGQYELLCFGLRFINTFLESAGDIQKRLYIQAELEQAGFDIISIKKVVSGNGTTVETVLKEIEQWEKALIDVEGMGARLKDFEKENICLKDKILLLERRIQILQEEKGVLMSLEKCLKDRCCELQDEVQSFKSSKPSKNNRSITSKIGEYTKIPSCNKNIIKLTKTEDSSPAEDEGISSSERSLTPEDDVSREQLSYDMYAIQNNPLTIDTKENHSETTKKISDDEEETTIEEVMEELQNIINDAETEQFASEKKLEDERRKKEDNKKLIVTKIKMKVDSYVSMEENESEIIPSNLQPQPPRRTRSLVHLYIPQEDYEYHEKELFFEDDTLFTSDESSDSLLSASKHHVPKPLKPNVPDSNRELLNTIMDAREKAQRNDSKKPYQKPVEIVKPIKRSESFQYMNTNEQLIQLQQEKFQALRQNFEGMYLQNKTNTPASTPVLRHARSKCKSKDTNRQKLKSKSLDRIGDGLDSMVDIVMTNNSMLDQRLHPKTDPGMFFDTRNNRTKDKVQEDKHRMFLPRFENGDINETHFYFPRIQESSSFLIKRGQVNAGLYSGQVIRDPRSDRRSCPAPPSSRTTHRNSFASVGKLSDLPSGLY